MMKNKKLLIVLCGVLILAVGVGIGAYAAGAFGTQSDPLVAKSYLDNVLTPTLKSQFESQLNTQVKALEDKISSSSSGNFAAVSLASGKTLKCGAGCEIIVTGGSASAYSAALTDVTSGSSISAGTAVTANHLLVVSTENSGLTASGSVSVLVRGSYTVS